MTKVNVYVVRHGQTYYNIYNKLQGWSNSPLTEKGIEDANTAGQKLANLSFAAAYCSDTTRAQQTVQTILNLNESGSVKKAQSTPFFLEKSFMVIMKEPTWMKLGM